MSGFSAIVEACLSRRELRVERRPGNALNIEIGAPMPRCMFQPPDGRGVTRDGGTLDWLRSGGAELDYGICCADKCPKVSE
jgi:hypothetical protein